MKKDTSFELINIEDAAKMLGVSLMTMRIWDKNGKLPAIRLTAGGHRKYKKEDLESFIKYQQK